MLSLLATASVRCVSTMDLGFAPHFKRRGEELIIILAGGDKSTQDRDIVLAKSLVAQLEE